MTLNVHFDLFLEELFAGGPELHSVLSATYLANDRSHSLRAWSVGYLIPWGTKSKAERYRPED